jgi:Phage tail tube protein, GTA-gp10
MAARDRGLPVARANRRRGEIEAVIDGERRILCLTLGALSELETAFGVDDLAALGAHFARGRLRADDLVRVLAAGLRGAGNLFSDEEVAAMGIDGGIVAAARIATELLEAAFADESEAAGGAPPNPMTPQQATRSRERKAPGRA